MDEVFKMIRNGASLAKREAPFPFLQVVAVFLFDHHFLSADDINTLGKC